MVIFHFSDGGSVLAACTGDEFECNNGNLIQNIQIYISLYLMFIVAVYKTYILYMAVLFRWSVARMSSNATTQVNIILIRL